MDKIEYALKIFKLDVKEMYEVSESYSSTVRILQLENGEKLVLKLPYNQSKLMREESVLKLLSQNTLVPDLIDTWYGDDSHNGALLMTYIDGDPMLSTDDDGLIYQAGKILAELHEVKFETFELDEKNDDWWGSLKQRFDRWMEEIIGFIPKDIFLASQDYFTGIVEKSQSVDGPRLTHFDYRPGNLLVKDHQIVGLIDFESSRGGSVDIDFTKIAEYIWKENPSSKEVFLEGYRSIRKIPDIENHLPIYEFFNAVGGIAWCVRRDKLQDNFYDENLKVIKACLAKIDRDRNWSCMMKKYERILESLFAKDCQFALATSHNNIPSVRIVDLYYCDGAFYLVSYKNSQKLMEIEANKTVALCQDMVRFKGQAYNIGHPLDETNKEIRQELTKVFEKWYFAHNDENDQNMCYVKIVLDEGFSIKDGMGYRMNFIEKSCKEFPFTFDLVFE